MKSGVVPKAELSKTSIQVPNLAITAYKPGIQVRKPAIKVCKVSIQVRKLSIQARKLAIKACKVSIQACRLPIQPCKLRIQPCKLPVHPRNPPFQPAKSRKRIANLCLLIPRGLAAAQITQPDSVAGIQMNSFLQRVVCRLLPSAGTVPDH